MLKLYTNPMRKARHRKNVENALGLTRRMVGYLSNKYVAFAFISLVLVSSYVIEPALWKYVFSALVSYFVASMIMRYSLRRDLFRLRHAGGSRVSEGHAFMIFIFLIIFATFFSNTLAVYIGDLVSYYAQARLLIIVTQTIITLGILLLDMKFEF